MQYNHAASGEIDMTSMSSTIYTDNNNSNHVMVRKCVDYSIVDMGELSCEFYGTGGFDESFVGTYNDLTVSGIGGDGLVVQPNGIRAYLTQVSTQIEAGGLVKGSCTFKLSDVI
jgi:hypothetical protein